MFRELILGARFALLTFVLLALAYPFAMVGAAQALFPHQANGSLIKGPDGKPIGSELVGQKFEGPRWFHGRPSAIDYKAESSGGSNLGPTSRKLVDRVASEVARLRAENPEWGDARSSPPFGRRPIPADLVTTTASGLDPHISPDAARLQVARVAAARRLSETEVQTLVNRHTEGRDLGLFGEPRVNVLKLNLALESLGGRGARR